MFGVTDDRMGEEVAAWIKLLPETTLEQDDVRKFCNGNLAHFKIPRYLEKNSLKIYTMLALIDFLMLYHMCNHSILANFLCPFAILSFAFMGIILIICIHFILFLLLP